MQTKLVEHRNYINIHGVDMPEVRDWKWNPTIIDKKTFNILATLVFGCTTVTASRSEIRLQREVFD